MISIDEELAALRAENARLRAEQGQGQFPGQAHVRILLSANGAIMPSQDQMRASCPRCRSLAERFHVGRSGHVRPGGQGHKAPRAGGSSDAATVRASRIIRSKTFACSRVSPSSCAARLGRDRKALRIPKTMRDQTGWISATGTSSPRRLASSSSRMLANAASFFLRLWLRVGKSCVEATAKP